MNLLEYEGRDKIVSSFEMQEKLKNKELTIRYISSGLRLLNTFIKGFCPGQLIVVSGISGEGKSTLCRTFTYNMEQQGINSLWFCYEDDTIRFLQKFPVLPLFYMPELLLDNTTDWVTKRIQEAKAKYNIEIVFIDHLHYLIDLETKINMSLHIGGYVRYLKRLAVNEKIVIFLVAHLQKIKTDEEPDIQDIRDSSFIGQEADKVLMISRGKEDNTATIRLSKDRDTGKKNKYVNLRFEHDIFWEVEYEQKPI